MRVGRGSGCPAKISPGICCIDFQNNLPALLLSLSIPSSCVSPERPAKQGCSSGSAPGQILLPDGAAPPPMPTLTLGMHVQFCSLVLPSVLTGRAGLHRAVCARCLSRSGWRGTPCQEAADTGHPGSKDDLTRGPSVGGDPSPRNGVAHAQAEWSSLEMSSQTHIAHLLDDCISI